MDTTPGNRSSLAGGGVPTPDIGDIVFDGTSLLIVDESVDALVDSDALPGHAQAVAARLAAGPTRNNFV